MKGYFGFTGVRAAKTLLLLTTLFSLNSAEAGWSPFKKPVRKKPPTQKLIPTAPAIVETAPMAIPDIFFRETFADEIDQIKEDLIAMGIDEALRVEPLIRQISDLGLLDEIETQMEEWRPSQSQEEHYYNIFLTSSEVKQGILVFSLRADGTSVSINALNIGKPYRGQGIGKEVLRKFELEMKNRGVQEITARVLDTNKELLNFYQKNGFSIAHTIEVGEFVIGHVMKKSL